MSSVFHEDDIAALLNEVEALRDRVEGHQIVERSHIRVINALKAEVAELKAQMEDRPQSESHLVARLSD